jgi:hypothetical protein
METPWVLVLISFHWPESRVHHDPRISVILEDTEMYKSSPSQAAVYLIINQQVTADEKPQQLMSSYVNTGHF